VTTGQRLFLAANGGQLGDRFAIGGSIAYMSAPMRTGQPGFPGAADSG
jgi:hypothetical protein